MVSNADQAAQKVALRKTFLAEVTREVRHSINQTILDRRISYPALYTESSFGDDLLNEFKRYLMEHRNGAIMAEYHKQHEAAYSA